ncbi:MAG: hypothetical protein DRP52_01495 [Planctomycetota bacterium]|nr:MAG: hypothetical protein DRP52_01495 [Planctomycetota bacterium]
MKKRDIRRRFKSLLKTAKDYFLEEEPREKAQRTLKEAGIKLNKTVYQRIAMEYELQHRCDDEETRAWCETTLEALRQTEQLQSRQLAVLREEYRKLAVQDLLYRALNEPDGDTFQQAHEALMELSATVETEKSVNSIPKLLGLDMQPRLAILSEKESDNFQQE